MEANSSSSKAKAKSESAAYGIILLRNQLKELTKNPLDDISVGLVDDSNIYEWQVLMNGPTDTLFEGGWFKATLSFPPDYPNKPPKMKFQSDMWHPNIHKDGLVCISILHEAKEDPFNTQEKMSEKWRPIIGIESVLVSVMSMLGDPNFESPANIDASVMLKNDPGAYKKKVRALSRKSAEEL